jgi:hypothetical protein
LNLETLNVEENKSIVSICKKFADVCHMEGDPYTHTNLYEQGIRIKPNTTPVYIKLYRIAHNQKPEIERQIKASKRYVR